MPLLIPGVGAQGGSLDLAAINGTGNFPQPALINVSRSVLYASEGADFAQKARAELVRLNDEVAKLRSGKTVPEQDSQPQPEKGPEQEQSGPEQQRDSRPQQPQSGQPEQSGSSYDRNQGGQQQPRTDSTASQGSGAAGPAADTGSVEFKRQQRVDQPGVIVAVVEIVIAQGGALF